MIEQICDNVQVNRTCLVNAGCLQKNVTISKTHPGQTVLVKSFKVDFLQFAANKVVSKKFGSFLIQPGPQSLITCFHFL